MLAAAGAVAGDAPMLPRETADSRDALGVVAATGGGAGAKVPVLARPLGMVHGIFLDYPGQEGETGSQRRRENKAKK